VGNRKARGGARDLLLYVYFFLSISSQQQDFTLARIVVANGSILHFSTLIELSLHPS